MKLRSLIIIAVAALGIIADSTANAYVYLRRPYYGRGYYYGGGYYARPYARGVWIPGHWSWRYGYRAWIPGHWR